MKSILVKKVRHTFLNDLNYNKTRKKNLKKGKQNKTTAYPTVVS